MSTRERDEKTRATAEYRLRRLYLLGFQHREQMEAAAKDACEILGVDPNQDTNDRDAAEAIVFLGSDPNAVIRLLWGELE